MADSHILMFTDPSPEMDVSFKTAIPTKVYKPAGPVTKPSSAPSR